MREYEWKCKAGDNNHGGNEATEIDWSTAFAVVSEFVTAAAMREECVRKGCDDECESCLFREVA